jgi:hypothetical protein
VPAPPSFIARTTPRASPLSRPRGGIYLAPLGSRQRAPTAVAFPASARVCCDALSGCEADPTPAPLGATTSESACSASQSPQDAVAGALALLAAAEGAGSKPIGLLKIAASSRFAAAHHRPEAQPPQHVTRHDK